MIVYIIILLFLVVLYYYARNGYINFIFKPTYAEIVTNRIMTTSDLTCATGLTETTDGRCKLPDSDETVEKTTCSRGTYYDGKCYLDCPYGYNNVNGKCYK
jgi:hypothetical protein